jgi:hypothetical protein
MPTLGRNCFGTRTKMHQNELQNAEIKVHFSRQTTASCEWTSDKRLEILKKFAIS